MRNVLSACVGCLVTVTSAATPLDDYVGKPSSHYAWHATGATFKAEFGCVAHVLNVTSQQWLDKSRAATARKPENGGSTDLWTHQVVVIVPKEVKHRNVSIAYLTGSCNDKPSVPKPTDEELLIISEVAWNTGTVGIVVYQLPNCPIVYPSDPSQKKRTEDAVIAWGWKQYLDSPLGQANPEWLAHVPMTKAAMSCMRAAQEWMQQNAVAEISKGGWFVAGASKRGWTTWLVGSVTCSPPECPNIVGIAPLVPIVPSLKKEIHRQWMAYGGWTFAFADYLAVNLTTQVDSPGFANAMAVVDPAYYYSRLSRLPKQAVLSSDDEFMMMDWSNIWYDEMPGENHLLIAQDSEHSLATGIPELVPALANMLASIAAGRTAEQRPSFKYNFENRTGRIEMTIPDTYPANTVKMWHAESLQSERRDFRWVRLAGNATGKCSLPDVPLPKPLFGGNCIQPIIWTSTTVTGHASLRDPGSKVYSALPPKPKHEGRWVGYYLEAHFASDTGLKEDFIFTTPGWTFPNTLPFADCTGEECRGHPL